MTTNTILLLVGIVIVIVVVAFLLKSLVKVAVFLCVIYILFHVGFLWSGTEVTDKIPFLGFLKPEYQQQAQEYLDGFSEKRDETGVMDTEAVRNTIDESIQKALSLAQNKIADIDKQKLIDEMNARMQDIDPAEMAAILQSLKDELAKYNMPEQDVQDIVGKISGDPIQAP